MQQYIKNPKFAYLCLMIKMHKDNVAVQYVDHYSIDMWIQIKPMF